MLGRGREALCEDASALLYGLFDAMTLRLCEGALHERLGAAWGLSRKQTDVLRRALVLLCDHELNPSTFAARVAAGTGGPLAASALAGYATLSGPLHGEAAQRAMAYLSECANDEPRRVLQRWAARGEGPPAVGHPLYSGGDPRAKALLAALKPNAAIARAINGAERASGESANIDLAIASMTRQWALPDTAPFTIFALARMVGWMAHAMEQRAASRMIRPRASYIGP
jgi:citrate synthase